MTNSACTSAGAKQGSGATVLDFAGRAARPHEAVLCVPLDPDNDLGPSAA